MLETVSGIGALFQATLSAMADVFMGLFQSLISPSSARVQKSVQPLNVLSQQEAIDEPKNPYLSLKAPSGNSNQVRVARLLEEMDIYPMSQRGIKYE